VDLLAETNDYVGNMKFRVPLLLVCLVFSTGAIAQERQWSLDTADNQAFLTFGVPDSEDVGLSLWCEIGKNQMSLFMPETKSRLRVGENVPMLVLVNGVRSQLIGIAAKDAASGLMSVEAKFGLKDRLISGLTDAQTISVRVKNHDTNFPFSDADFSGLLATCKGENEK